MCDNGFTETVQSQDSKIRRIFSLWRICPIDLYVSVLTNASILRTSSINLLGSEQLHIDKQSGHGFMTVPKGYCKWKSGR